MAFSPLISSHCSSSSSTSRIFSPTKLRPILRSSSSSSSSLSTASNSVQFDLKTYWTALIAEINKKLEEAIPVKYPERIYEAMRYSVLDEAAKRAPPVMCIASIHLSIILSILMESCSICCLRFTRLRSSMMTSHAWTTLRRARGRPSNHTIYGVDMAILAGDALFPLGFQHIVTNTPPEVIPENRILRVIAEFARAVGSTGMAAGQFVDLRNGNGNGDRERVVEFVQEKKFGEMAECSAVCGGLLAGAADEEVARLRRYGRAVGVLYQVVDDVMESRRDGGEGVKNKKSFVRLYGLERAMERAEELREEAKRVLDGFVKVYGETKVAPLYSFVDYAVDRSFVVGDGEESNQGSSLKSSL
ncbi:hypothetical protein Scep_020099 [Stephania cephalantha]|uniref:Geranylgeranyl pyrophosphate synthase n=1 Tax=Stephania cephalantha TaxID=152367 RepID=A0AAP0IC60_9MAGN